jgi:hypothetical protein
LLIRAADKMEMKADPKRKPRQRDRSMGAFICSGAYFASTGDINRRQSNVCKT